MKVAIYYTLLPLAAHAAVLAALFVLQSVATRVLLTGPGMAAFLLGGIVFLPCVLLHILVALVRRRRLQEASKTRLFLSGACNPVPLLFLLWLWFAVSAMLSHA